MSIWIHRDKLDRETGEAIYKDCTIIEELSDYDKSLGKTPGRILMFEKTNDKSFFIVPYRIARKYGYNQENPYWRQIVYPVRLADGNVKYCPEFTGNFRDYQIEIIPEIIDCLQKNNTVIIGLPPGWGKTIIAAYLLWMIGLLSVVVVKQKKVYHGWQKTFKKVLPNARVWLVGDEPMPDHFDIILCMNERIGKIPLNVVLQVGTLIIDETHTISTLSQIWTFLLWRPKYVIFETATFKASPFWKMAAAVSAEDGVFRISKIPYNFYVVRTGVEGEETRSEKTGRLIPSSVQKSLIENKKRKKILQTVIYNHIGYRKFIGGQFVTTEIDDNIIYLNNLGITCDTLWGNKNGYNQSMVLFVTYGKASTGFDEENACDNYWILPVKSDTGIFVNSIDSPWLMIQFMGRCMRTEDEVPAFIFFLDDNKNVKGHLNHNKWLIELTNGRIINVDYRTPFIQMNPKKGIKFTHSYVPMIFYKILRNHEYSEFLEKGFYSGTEEEVNKGFVMLQLPEYVTYYRNILCPNTPCFLVAVQYCNLYNNNGTIFVDNGIVFCRHPIFYKNILSVTMI